jgi:microcompartment protein CcmK/EutM
MRSDNKFWMLCLIAAECIHATLVVVTAGAAASREKVVVFKSSEKARKASHSQSPINIMIISIIGPTDSALCHTLQIVNSPQHCAAVSTRRARLHLQFHQFRLKRRSQ